MHNLKNLGLAIVIGLVIMAAAFGVATVINERQERVEIVEVAPAPAPQPPPVPSNPQGFVCRATVAEFKSTVKNAVPSATFWEPRPDLSAQVMVFYNSIPPVSNVPGGSRIIIVPPNDKQPRPYLAIIDNVGGNECVIINGFFGANVWAEIAKRWPQS